MEATIGFRDEQDDPESAMARTDGQKVDQWITDLAEMRSAKRRAEHGTPLQTPRPRADAEIAAEVEQAIARDPELQSAQIRVAVAGGMVTLEGEVATRFCKHWAARLADRSHGVVDVHNRLRVREDGPLSVTA